MAFFPTLDAYDGYSSLAPASFVNDVCARVIPRSHGYRPLEHLPNVRCPVLIQICDQDSLAPISVETEKQLREYADVKHYPIGHFDIYAGQYFENAVNEMIALLKSIR